jgi:Flp pilus assembly protein TadG
MRALRRLRRDETGNVLLELALVTPVLVALLIGIVDFGRGAYTSMSLRSAARAGAEYVSRTGDTSDLTTVVAEAANLQSTGLSVVPTTFCECDAGAPATCGGLCSDGTSVRQFIAVDVQKAYTPMLPYPGVPSPVTLSGRAILRVR